MAASGAYIGSIAILLLAFLLPDVCALPARYAVNDDSAIAWLQAPKDAQGPFPVADAFPTITETGG
jgi:hypothetical protein